MKCLTQRSSLDFGHYVQLYIFKVKSSITLSHSEMKCLPALDFWRMFNYLVIGQIISLYSISSPSRYLTVLYFRSKKGEQTADTDADTDADK